MDPRLQHPIALAVAFILCAIATRVVRAVAPRLDFVSRPKGERWSTAPTPMGGGVAMFVTIAPALLLLSPDLLLGATIVHILGLVDDRRNLSPAVKLVFQTVAACVVVAAPIANVLAPGASPGADAPVLGALMPLESKLLAIPITIAFYVGVANSTNLLDNMDGSAAGVTCVAAVFVYLLAQGGDPSLSLAAAAMIGATAGFLTQNYPPARIFMGDAGSLLLGFTIAGLAVRLPTHDGFQGLVMMAFVVGAPLFDTALVFVTRRRARRRFLQGGRDHTTHRLMALGLSPRRTLTIVYGMAALLGGVAIVVARGNTAVAVAAVAAAAVLLVLLGVFLGDVPAYKTPEGALVPESRSPAALYAVELAVDGALLSACWLGAYAIRFDGEDLGFYLRASALPALPFVIGAKVLMLLLFDLYRGFWRTIRFTDVAAIGQAVALGSVLVVMLATVTQRFEHYSRGVFAIDALLSLVAVVGSRSAMRLFRDTVERLLGHSRKAALLGPEALRDLVARGIARERYELVAVIPVGAPEAVVAAARAAQATVVLIGVPLEESDPVVEALKAAGLEVRRVRASLE